MPKGVTPPLGPDATGVGWVYQYALLAKDKTLAELRTIQDWYVRYQLTKAHGVAEVASIGGFVQTYQVTVDPVKLRAYGIPLIEGRAGHPRLQPRCRRARRRNGRNRVHGARQGLSARQGRHRNAGRQKRQGHAGADPRHRPRRTGAGRAARPDRAQRRRRSGVGHRHGALRRERAGGHPQSQGQDGRNRRRPAGGRDDRDGLRPLRTDPSRHRHAEAHAARGKRSSSRWSASSSCCTCAPRWSPS